MSLFDLISRLFGRSPWSPMSCKPEVPFDGCLPSSWIGI